MPLTVDPSAAAPLPSRTTLGGAHGSPDLGKQEFLQLLVAQLRNQDPLNPSNPEDMAAQLAQFSSVEQLISINEQLTTQAASHEAVAASLNNTTAVGLIGKTVLTAGDRIELSGEGRESVAVVVGAGGGNAVLTLYDADGSPVGSRDLGRIDGGRQDLELGALADDLDAGTYHYGLAVTGDDGSPVEVVGLTSARIDGVRYGSAGPMALAGPIEIPLGEIVEILAR